MLIRQRDNFIVSPNHKTKGELTMIGNLSAGEIVTIIVVASLTLGGLGAYVFRPKKKKQD